MYQDWSKSDFPPSILSRCVLAVLVLHLVLFLTVGTAPLPKSLSPREFVPEHVVELLNDNRPVVRSAPRDEDKQQEAKFRSDRRNRVAEETRNPRAGTYQERSVPHQPSPPTSVEDGLGSPVPKLQMSDLARLSQDPYKLDDSIREGDQTVLNTDGLSYASFLHRISDAIYPAWVRHLRDATEVLHLERKPGGIVGSSFITRLGVEMDTDGNIVSLQVLKSSGVPEFDDAPKSAFWDKEPFRNPPSQMFADNEPTVRFVYEFHFELKSSAFSILPSISL